MAIAKATLPRPATPLARVLRGPQGIRRNRVAFIRLPTRAITISPIAVTPPPARVIPEGRSTGRLAVVVGIQVEAVARPTLGHLVAVVAATPAAAAAPRTAAAVVVLHPAVVAEAATPAAVVHVAAAAVGAVLHPAEVPVAVPTAAETPAKAPASDV
jgi:hypothetical protein